ncbi:MULTISPECIES: amidohydrolase [Pseudomonas]|uniref:amidohydrolase n=1 Tax=Pseudomonas guariconensis TaxID=1288410 RepID=UPI002096BFB9|nr:MULTISPECIES: amidohydrolase [Pseudomonas]MCO7593810.1 amidohydrolase [Pseudomonas guariconensis]MCO7631245.1 amidohydrolase [Pseudomonas guariconensis]MCU7219583.1 amidohydrolase [Pseudomonas brassicacearum]
MNQDPPNDSRRHFLAATTVLGAAGALWSSLPFASASDPAHANHSGGSMTADLILFNGRLHTVDPEKPSATAVAIKDGRFIAVGSDAEAMALRGAATRTIDLNRRTVVPGLNDSHLHLIRGGLNYNLELRWEGVPSLADALRMLKDQADRTPAPQWVRVVGGWTEFQFAEKRMPTLEELNKAAPDTPVFVLHLYDRALLNRAALKVVGYDRNTPNPPGGEIQRDASGEPTGMLIARPNAMILYATLAKGPKLPLEYQVNSTRQFMRELNRLGLTSAIDAGGGFQNYPDDYQVIQELADKGQLTVRIAYNLFTQKPKEELADFQNWSKLVKPGDGSDFFRHNGAGEMLVFSAADFEDFLEPRPDLPATMEQELEPVVRHLVEQRWPFRLHATYDESISRMLDVFEKVDRDIPFNGLPWFFDHAETVSPRNIERIRALGGGIAIQHRMAFQGEYFVDRYGAKAAETTPPIQRMLAEGVPVGAGTDATRVASYNPWTALYWLVSGKTVGGLELYPQGLGRDTALQLFTQGSAWFSSEQGKKGQIKVGQFADLIALSADYFSVEEEAIKWLESVLTVVDGKVVHAAAEFDKLAPPALPVMPDWSPVNKVPGHWKPAAPLTAQVHQCVGACAVHAHQHDRARRANVPVSDYQGFWGAFGCSCFAF